MNKAIAVFTVLSVHSLSLLVIDSFMFLLYL